MLRHCKHVFCEECINEELGLSRKSNHKKYLYPLCINPFVEKDIIDLGIDSAANKKKNDISQKYVQSADYGELKN